MIRRITLENYMSHAHTVIEPAAGLTVLVGPNNCGKSAVVSALETLARNVAGDFMVRHGEREAKVTLETDDGHTLVWRRKGDKVGYEVDGRAVDRLRGGVPEDLHDLLKLPLVESARGGGEAFDVHFGHQKSPIFLLDEPESRAATFFSASSDAGRLLEIQDRHRDKVRDRKRRRADVVDEIDRLDAQLAALAPLDEVAPLLDAADVMQSDLSARSDAIRGIEQTISRIASARRAGERCGSRARVLESLAVPPQLEDDAALATMVRSLRAARRKVEKGAAKRQAASELAPPPAMVEVEALRREVREIKRLARAVDRARSRRESLKSLHEPPVLADPAPVAQLVTKLRAAESLAREQRQRVAGAAKSLEVVEQQLRRWADANLQCPICGGDVTAEKLIAGGHAHG